MKHCQKINATNISLLQTLRRDAMINSSKIWSVIPMKLLVAKRNGMSDAELEKLAGLGFELVLDAVDYKPYTGDTSDIEAVICYQFFNHNDIKAFPKLKLIHLTSAGYDHMPLEYLREKGIALYNARGVYSVAIAEFVLGGVLQLYKEAAYFRSEVARRGWRQLQHLRELSEKNVTILGAGSIAAEIAKRFSAMGCRVTALCRNPDKAESGFDAVCKVEELDEILPGTDIMILAAPLNEGTFHIMNASRFGLIKKGSVFVNIARGGLVDTPALVEALECGNLSGAVIDVFETEPLEADNPLWEMENLIITPHNSFAGEFNGRRTFELMYRDLSQWLRK